MRLVTIDEVLKLEPEESIPAIRGRISSIFEPKTGTTDKGDYSFQNGKLKDASGREIPIKLKDREAIPQNWKGKEVIIQCASGPKGLSGVKARDDDYKNRVTRIIWITPSAIIDLAENVQDAGEGQESEPSHQAPQRQQSRPPAQPPAQTRQQTAPPPSDEPLPQDPDGEAPQKEQKFDVPKVKRELNQLANLYLHCLNAGDYVRATYDAQVREYNTKVDPEKALPIPLMSVDQHQACVSSMYIQATRLNMQRSIPPGKF